MLYPLDNFTSKAWHQAIDDNQLAIRNEFLDRTTSLSTWLARRLSVPSRAGMFDCMFIACDGGEGIRPKDVTEFGWCQWTLDLESLPANIRHEWPPSQITITTYGTKVINGGLIKSQSGEWSSHT